MPKVLLIAPSFFGYRDRVGAMLAEMGFEVDIADDRPNESVAFRSLGKVSYRLVDSAISRYADSLRERVGAGGYDRVIYMGGMSFCFTPQQMRRIRESSRAVFSAYLWDSLDNCQRVSSCLELFDRVDSFEPQDCANGRISLRPLFYGDEYAGIPLAPRGGFDYDACFVGSVHQPSKFHSVKRMCDRLEARGLRIFRYFYMPSSSAKALRMASDGAYRDVDLESASLPLERVLEVYARSRAIIDSPQRGQLGLTMRTVEAVGARRKLITTNPDVANYDFFPGGDVAIWDDGEEILSDFFDAPYRELPKEIYESYSIEAFAASLVGKGAAYAGYSKRGGRR